MFKKKMLLSYKYLNFLSFAMHDEKYDRIVYTHHYDITYKETSWWGLVNKIVTKRVNWNAPSKDDIEKQLNEKIGKYF